MFQMQIAFFFPLNALFYHFFLLFPDARHVVHNSYDCQGFSNNFANVYPQLHENYIDNCI